MIHRLNIYLDDHQLKGQVLDSGRPDGLTLSRYCVGAIRRRLAEEKSLLGAAVGYEGRMPSEGDEVELPEAEGERLVEAGVVVAPKAARRRSKK